MSGMRLFIAAAAISCAATVLVVAGYRMGSTIGVCPALPIKAGRG